MLRRLRHLDLPTARAAVWAWRSLRDARRRLKVERIDAIRLAAPPALPPHAARGVTAVLRRTPNTCLERSLVLQRWLAAQGEPRDIVVGVAGPAARFKAHAWLDGEPGADTGFDELTRVRWVEGNG